MKTFSFAVRVALLGAAIALPAQALQLSNANVDAPASPGTPAQYAAVEYAYHDGSTEDALGLTNGGEMAWITWFDPVGSGVVTHIDTAVGTPTGTSPAAGGALTVYVWDDVNNDGNPSDAVLLATGSGVVTAPGTDTITTYALDTPVTLTSRFFIGAMTAHAPGQFPGPMDEGQASQGRTWVVGDTTSNFDPNNLLANDVAPVELDSIGFPAVWLIQAGGEPWTDLGNGLAGGAGTPVLSGTGSLVGGTPLSLILSGAAADANATLVIGKDTLMAPFKGGVLVPQVDLLYLGLTTDAGGGLTLSSQWPIGLGPRTFYFQYWIQDAGGPAGFAASNALSGAGTGQ